MSRKQIDEKQEREDNIEFHKRYDNEINKLADLMTPALSILWYIRHNDTQEAYDYVQAGHSSGIDAQKLYNRYQQFKDMREERDKAFRATSNVDTSDKSK
jgi:hypothetical protein